MQRHSGNGWLGSGLIIYLILYAFLIRNKENKLKFSLLYWYCAVLIDLTLFPIPYNLAALQHIQEKHQFSMSLTLFTGTSKLQNLLNLLMFIPFGVLVPLYFPKLKTPKIFSIIFLTTLSIEVIQLISSLLKLNVRIFDVDDLLFNFLGGVLGYCVYRFTHHHTKKS